MDYITDLRHFLDERGEIPGVMPKKAREFAGFLALVVDECTLAESESESESAPNTSHVTGIACRERGCPGVVQAGLRTSDDRIRWACMICDGNGLISGWRGTRWDNIPESGSDGPRPDASATDAAATAASSATATATATDEDDEGPIEFRGPVKGSGPAAELFNVFLAEHPGGRFCRLGGWPGIAGSSVRPSTSRRGMDCSSPWV